MVFLGEGGAKQSHDPVAHHLVDRAFVPVDGIHHELQDGVQELPGFLWIAFHQKLHRPLEIGKEHRHLLALTLESCLRCEYPVSEVPGRVGARRAEPCR